MATKIAVESVNYTGFTADKIPTTSGTGVADKTALKAGIPDGDDIVKNFGIYKVLPKETIEPGNLSWIEYQKSGYTSTVEPVHMKPITDPEGYVDLWLTRAEQGKMALSLSSTAATDSVNIDWNSTKAITVYVTHNDTRLNSMTFQTGGTGFISVAWGNEEYTQITLTPAAQTVHNNAARLFTLYLTGIDASYLTGVTSNQITITQDASPADGYITLSQPSASLSYASGVTSFTVSLTRVKSPVSVTKKDTNNNWYNFYSDAACTRALTTVANGGTVYIKYDDNTVIDAGTRSDKIIVSGTDSNWDDGRSAEFSISQSAAPTYHFYYKAVDSAGTALSGVVWSMKNGSTNIADGTTKEMGEMYGATTATTTLSLNMSKNDAESISASPTAITLTSGATSGAVTVTLTNASYSGATTGESWQSVSSLSNKQLTISATSRVEGETSARSANVTLKATSTVDYDAISNKSISSNSSWTNVAMTLSNTPITETIKVTQNGAAASGKITPSSNSISAGNTGGTYSFTVALSSIKGNASVSSNATWVTVSPTSVANGGEVTVTVSSNNYTDVSARNATITISGTDAVYNNTKSATVSVSQTAPTTYHYRGTVRISGTTTAIGGASVSINNTIVTANSNGQFSYSSLSDTSFTAKASKSGNDSLTLTLGNSTVGSGATSTTIKGVGVGTTGDITLSANADWLSLDASTIKNNDSTTVNVSGQSYSASARTHTISGSVASDVSFTEGSITVSSGDSYGNYIDCPRKTVTGSVTLTQSSGSADPSKTYHYYYVAKLDGSAVNGASWTMKNGTTTIASGTTGTEGQMYGSFTTTGSAPTLTLEIAKKDPAARSITITPTNYQPGSGATSTTQIQVTGTWSSYSLSTSQSWITATKSGTGNTIAVSAQANDAPARSGTVVYTTDTTTGYTALSKSITTNTSWTDVALTANNTNATATLTVNQASGSSAGVDFSVKLQYNINFNLASYFAGEIAAEPYIEMWLTNQDGSVESNIYGDSFTETAYGSMDGMPIARGSISGALGSSIECSITLPQSTTGVYVHILVRESGWAISGNQLRYEALNGELGNITVGTYKANFELVEGTEYRAFVAVNQGPNMIEKITLGGWLT